MLTVDLPVQFIAWKDRPRNDLLCIERDDKQLLTHSLTHCKVCLFTFTKSYDSLPMTV